MQLKLLLLEQLETGAARAARDGHRRISAGWSLREQREMEVAGAARDGGCWRSASRSLQAQRVTEAAGAARWSPLRPCWSR